MFKGALAALLATAPTVVDAADATSSSVHLLLTIPSAYHRLMLVRTAVSLLVKGGSSPLYLSGPRCTLRCACVLRPASRLRWLLVFVYPDPSQHGVCQFYCLASCTGVSGDDVTMRISHTKRTRDGGAMPSSFSLVRHLDGLVAEAVPEEAVAVE